MRVGFTGTRRGMSPRQQSRVFSILYHFKAMAPSLTFLHGDCKGADEEANDIAWNIGIPIETYPPINSTLRAYCKNGVRIVHEPADYLKRDRAIVKGSNLLIGAPLGNGKSQKGGTWYTIHYAQKKHKDLIVCYTNGLMTLSRADLMESPEIGELPLA